METASDKNAKFFQHTLQFLSFWLFCWSSAWFCTCTLIYSAWKAHPLKHSENLLAFARILWTRYSSVFLFLITLIKVQATIMEVQCKVNLVTLLFGLIDFLFSTNGSWLHLSQLTAVQNGLLETVMKSWTQRWYASLETCHRYGLLRHSWFFEPVGMMRVGASKLVARF